MSATEEVAAALRIPYGVASERMHYASRLVNQFPATRALVAAGQLSYAHAVSLVRATKDLDPVVAGQVEERVLTRAPQQTVGQFRSSIRRAVLTLDPRDAEQKHQTAAEQRRVCVEPADDGMAWINAHLDAAGAQTVMTAVNAVAKKIAEQTDTELAKAVGAGGHDCRSADQLRADALVAICAAVLNDDIDGLPKVGTWQGQRPQIQVTVALSTLLGLDEQPGELAGYGPITAEHARRLAADPTGTWHRLIHDEHGRLIDYGRTRYRPPQDLTDHVIARDRTCRGPNCHRDARRTELDHLVPWAEGGQTNAANLTPLCPTTPPLEARRRLDHHPTPRRPHHLDHTHRPHPPPTPRTTPHRPHPRPSRRRHATTVLS